MEGPENEPAKRNRDPVLNGPQDAAEQEPIYQNIHSPAGELLLPEFQATQHYKRVIQGLKKENAEMTRKLQEKQEKLKEKEKEAEELEAKLRAAEERADEMERNWRKTKERESQVWDHLMKMGRMVEGLIELNTIEGCFGVHLTGKTEQPKRNGEAAKEAKVLCKANKILSSKSPSP